MSYLGRTLGLAALTLAALTGCSIVAVSETDHYSDREGQLPQSLFAEIKPGHTSKDWIHAHFGAPLSVQESETGEIHTWQFTRTLRQDTSLLFFARYRGLDQRREYFHVAFTGDLVERHWVDGLPLAQ